MISYVTVGADDIAKAKRFFSAFLPALDYGLTEGPEEVSFVLPVAPGETPVLPDFYVKPTFDGGPASAGMGRWSPLKRATLRIGALLPMIEEVFGDINVFASVNAD